MQRIPEPELMLDPEQTRAYAEADFEQPHSMFMRLFQEAFPDVPDEALVLDLGCGPGDITFRFVRAYPYCRVHGIDGSDAMLAYARSIVKADRSLQGRVIFIKEILPFKISDFNCYDSIICNSLLHHLNDPHVLWKTVKACAKPGAAIFIMDLRRPADITEAEELTETYAADEPAILRRDFYNSLLAAFEIKEIEQQIREAGLGELRVQALGDRHALISGRRATQD